MKRAVGAMRRCKRRKVEYLACWLLAALRVALVAPVAGKVVLQRWTGIFLWAAPPCESPTASDVEGVSRWQGNTGARTAPQRASKPSVAASSESSVAKMRVSDLFGGFSMTSGAVLDGVGVLGRYGGSPVAAQGSVCE